MMNLKITDLINNLLLINALGVTVGWWSASLEIKKVIKMLKGEPWQFARRPSIPWTGCSSPHGRVYGVS
jgi:hypothetical protein